jgi:short subunit dehydrogenase-like uncharacterized protein
MIYGAGGYTGRFIARHAYKRGHHPLLAGRTKSALTMVAEQLDAPLRTVSLDDRAELRAALVGVDVVLNMAGPFLRTASPLAEACIDAGTHYLDISNELQVFCALYDLSERARNSGVALVPGVGFGVVATNCLARYVSDAVGGAEQLEVASYAATVQGGPGVAATIDANLPYGGWIRRGGQLRPEPFGTGVTTLTLPFGTVQGMPIPTGDLEAAFRATGAPNVTAYAVEPDPAGGTDGPSTYTSHGWARATSANGASAEAWLRTGESYAFTAEAAVRAVEETLVHVPTGALSPAEAFGVDFVLTLPDTVRMDTIARQPRSDW